MEIASVWAIGMKFFCSCYFLSIYRLPKGIWQLNRILYRSYDEVLKAAWTGDIIKFFGNLTSIELCALWSWVGSSLIFIQSQEWSHIQYFWGAFIQCYIICDIKDSTQILSVLTCRNAAIALIQVLNQGAICPVLTRTFIIF